MSLTPLVIGTPSIRGVAVVLNEIDTENAAKGSADGSAVIPRKYAPGVNEAGLQLLAGFAFLQGFDALTKSWRKPGS